VVRSVVRGVVGWGVKAEAMAMMARMDRRERIIVVV